MALAKVMDTLPDEINSVLSTVGDRIHFNLNSLVDYNSCKGVFNKLDKAIGEEVNVWIKYYTHSRDETTKRMISPYALEYKEEKKLLKLRLNLVEKWHVGCRRISIIKHKKLKS